MQMFVSSRYFIAHQGAYASGAEGLLLWEVRLGVEHRQESALQHSLNSAYGLKHNDETLFLRVLLFLYFLKSSGRRH